MDTIVTLTLLVLFGAALALDQLVPARTFPRSRFWRLRGLVSVVAYFAVAIFAPLLWDEWLGAHRLIDATSLGPWLGAPIAILAASFLAYGWHRALHRVPFLFRIHQMHHSAERVDIYGAFWFHPLDALGFTLMGSLALVLGVGVDAEAAVLANGVLVFAGFFQHCNLRTPRWVGWFLQRPENHSIHHERGVHAFNYGDLALWDMIFGTYRNPATWEGVGGFYDGGSERVAEMLVLRDVTEPPSASAPSVEGAQGA